MLHSRTDRWKERWSKKGGGMGEELSWELGHVAIDNENAEMTEKSATSDG